MIKRIQVLDMHTANLIAAGEVVERPQSVVKELVENALDAGAKNITVEIKNGGVSYIRVTDDGCGIQATDALVAFARHATNKISTEEDLQRIFTLGFRGEALSSISAVSTVELFSKTRDSECGIHVVMEGGLCIKQEPAGCPQGTTIIVRNLFFNTPARMKFLKKDATEAGAVQDLMGKLILGNQEVSFRFLNQGKEVYFSSGNGKLLDSLVNVWGISFRHSFLEVNYEAQNIKVIGLTGKADAARANRTFQNVYLNGRTIRSRTVTGAVEEAYRNVLVGGRFPAFVLHLQVDPSLVDVNVHPTKMEVKFSDERALYQTVLWAVQNALQVGATVPKMQLPAQSTKGIWHEAVKGDTWEQQTLRIAPAQDYSKSIKTEPIISEPSSFHKPLPSDAFDQVHGKTVNENKTGFGEPVKLAHEADFAHTGNVMQASTKGQPTSEEAAAEPVVPYNEVEPVHPLPVKAVETPMHEGSQKTVSILPDFRIVGQLFHTYIVIERDGEMVLIDQHAAHERLLYEKLRANYTEGNLYPQKLLVPIVVEWSATDLSMLKENIPLLERLGFELEEFGLGSMVIRQTPLPVGDKALEALLYEMLQKIKVGHQKIQSELEYELLYMVACKAAIKAHDKISGMEMEKLVSDVLTLENIHTCPHGRPFLVSLSKYQLEKQFKRVL